MRLPAALIARWDLDADTRAALPFDRALALVNLRRVEIACLLAILSNIGDILVGHGVAAVLVRIPLAAFCWIASRRILHWRSLRAQEVAVVAFVVVGLGIALVGSLQLGQQGRAYTGYLINLLAITMLFVIPPRTLALIVGTLCILYWQIVLALPIPASAQTRAIVTCGLVSVISMIGGLLIHAARRADHDQRRIIREQNLRLTQHVHDMDQLMAITAHDLRSPLYGIRNLLALATSRAPPETGWPVEPVREAISGLDAMIALVSRLLDAHSAEYAPLASMRSEDVRPHLAEAVRRVGPAFETSEVAVDLALPDRPLIALFDAHGLSHILDNLLANAVRFSPGGATVFVRCSACDDAVVIEIEDRGPGFDALGRAAMFTKFHQRQGGATAKAGSGMGLFIAAIVAKRMNGELGYRAAEPTGAHFSLELPTAQC